jgi:hypothetical protein
MIDHLRSVEDESIPQLRMHPRRKDIQHKAGIRPVHQVSADITPNPSFILFVLGLARNLMRAIPIVFPLVRNDAEAVRIDMNSFGVRPRHSRLDGFIFDNCTLAGCAEKDAA